MGRSLLILAVAAVAVIGGLMRLLWDTPQLKPIDVTQATRFSECFGTRGEIAASAAPVTVAPVRARESEKPARDAIKPEAVESLIFRVLSALPVELPDTKLRADFDKGTPVRLPPDAILTVKGRDEFDFVLEGGTVEVRRAGANLLLRADKKVRFGPVERASYEVSLADETTIDAKDVPNTNKKQATLPVGTQGKLKLAGGQALVALQPFTVAPWPYDIPPTLVPVRAAGQRGLGDLTIEARQPGLQFNVQGLTLLACVVGDGVWRSAGVSETKAREPGAATVSISIPAGVLPGFRNWKSIVTDIELAVASGDGQYVAYGAFRAFDRAWAAGGAAILTGLLFAWLLKLRREEFVVRRVERLEAEGHADAAKTAQAAETGFTRWIAGLFIGPDNDPSLSLFQIFIWTVVTVWGLAYVFLVTGSLLSLTPEMMALLGIAGTGSVLARWVAERGQGGSTSQSSVRQADTQFEFWHILSTNGRFDLLKLQLFVFTLVIALYVVWRILDAGAFPALDANTLLLLGVSQGIYIGGKVVSTSPLSRAQALKLELDVKYAAERHLQDELSELNSKKKDLEDQKTALKDQFAKQAELNAISAAVVAKEKEIQDLKAATTAVKANYDKALKEAAAT
jgi:hypothetical protein